MDDETIHHGTHRGRSGRTAGSLYPIWSLTQMTQHQHPGRRKGIKNKTLKPELTCQRCHLPKPREQVVDHVCTQCRHEIDNKTTNANCPGCGVLKTKANTYLRPGGRIGSRCKKCEKRAGSVRLMIVRAKASGDPKAWVLKQIAATRRLWAEYEALLATIEKGTL